MGVKKKKRLPRRKFQVGDSVRLKPGTIDDMWLHGTHGIGEELRDYRWRTVTELGRTLADGWAYVQIKGIYSSYGENVLEKKR